MLDRNIGNTGIALADAQRQAREDAQDERDAQILAEGRELLAAFPRVVTPAMLKRLLDLGDEASGISTEHLLDFLLEQFRAGNLGARLLMGRFWRVAQDYPDLLPEPEPKVTCERRRVTGSSLDRLVEQLR